jgi:hypothetical protein
MSCSQDTKTFHPIIGSYYVTYDGATWTWIFKSSGELIETTETQIIGGGLWSIEEDTLTTVTTRHGELIGELRKTGSGWEYETPQGIYILKRF